MTCSDRYLKQMKTTIVTHSKAATLRRNLPFPLSRIKRLSGGSEPAEPLQIKRDLTDTKSSLPSTSQLSHLHVYSLSSSSKSSSLS